MSPRFNGFIILFMFLTMNAFTPMQILSVNFDLATRSPSATIMAQKPTLQIVDNVAVPTKISSLYRLNLSPGLSSKCDRKTWRKHFHHRQTPVC